MIYSISGLLRQVAPTYCVVEATSAPPPPTPFPVCLAAGRRSPC